MKKKKPRLSLFILLSFVVCAAAAVPFISRAALQDPQSSSPASSTEQKTKLPQSVPGEILVRFRKDAAPKAARSEMSVRQSGRQISVQIERLSGPEIIEGLRLARVAAEDTTSAIEALRSSPDVLYAEPNFMRYAEATPNDPRFGELWGLKNTGQTGGTAGADIKAEQAWDVTTGSRTIVVGIVDQGIDINHPDLKDNIWTNAGEIPGNGIDDDSDGYVDDVHGWDFAHNDNSVFDYALTTYPPSANYAADIDDHGTHVAGTIGATGNNAIGIAGVNWQVSILPLKFLAAGGGNTADLLKALAYAKMMRDSWTSSGGTRGANIRVLNNSYGGGGFSQAELDAIRALSASDILFVASAGNNSSNNDQVPAYPAGYSSSNVIAVAASTSANARAGFSNYGSTTVHMAAPGQVVLSTTPLGTYSSFSGTSMAAPHVSGVAALVMAASPNTSMARLRAALLYSGYSAPWQNVAPPTTITGRSLDAKAAVQNIALIDSIPPAAVGQFKITNSNFPTYSLQWLAPGDDNNAGTAAAYQIRFSDTDFSDPANFESARPLPAPLPANQGTSQQFDAKIPYRHPSGFIGIRAIDKVGNAGPISSVAVVADANLADPYIVSETNASQLSTGGTALGLKGDDVSTSYVLPFPFTYFGRFNNATVTVSANGTLYIGGGPGGFFGTADPSSSVGLLNGYSMIAGMWDDLRTDRRTTDDVYVVVPDGHTTIFRWQAVTYDIPLGPGLTRGEHPVSFEIELHSDSTIILRYGDGNESLLPVVGISGGAPDAYSINSHSSENGLISLANAATVTFTPRNPQPLPKADLSVNIFLNNPDPVSTGNQITYSIFAQNLSFQAPPFVVITDQLPAGTTFVSCTPANKCSGPPVGTNGVVKVNLPNLPNQPAVNINIVVQVDAAPGMTLTNTATISGGWDDPNSANNSSTVTNDVEANVLFGDVKAIATGVYHTLALKTDGTVWGWGGSDHGALGDGTFGGTNYYPSKVVGLTDVIAIAAGDYFSLALKSDGTVWAWGNNYYGALGVGVDPGSGTPRDHGFPVQVHSLTNIQAIAAGDEHSLALRNDGTVWAWGYNGPGQLGDGTQTNRSEPVQVSGIANVISIAGGHYHSVAARSDGTAWGWGYNSDGQARPGAGGQYVLVPAQVPGVSNVLSVSAGSDHSFALMGNGQVLGWGSNHYGALGSSDTRSNGPLLVPGLSGVTALDTCGHSLAVKSDSTVWIWGNKNGAPDDQTLDYSPAPVPGLSDVIAVSAGSGFSAAVLSDRTVRMWGNNGNGQLGDGTTLSRITPAPVSGLAVVATPTFELASGTYVGEHTIFMHCLTNGATIHYTMNGNDPTENDPVNTSSIFINHGTTTFKAKAWKSGWTPSKVRTAIYSITIWIDDPTFFVSQHYSDFLGRQADQAGLEYWRAQITQCGTDQLCIHNQRIAVSAAFFIELEFQLTGSVVYRMYRAAYGARPDAPSRANISAFQFGMDRGQLLGGSGLSQNTINFANNFVQRSAFTTEYPNTMSNADFVNHLFDKASLSGQQNAALRQTEIDAMTNNGRTRGQVLLDVIEIQEFKDREYKPSFVLMQYFGYLLRDPDQGGYDFWLNILNNRLPQDASGYRAMVCAFITSGEYQLRFGSQVTHTNQECN